MVNSKENKQGNTTTQYIASCIGIVFFGVAFLALGAIMPLITKEYGLSDRMSATLASVLPIGTLIGSLIFGPVIDRKGYKAIMIISNLIGAAGLVIMATTGNVAFLILGIGILGISGGLINGLSNALASDVSNDGNRDRRLMFIGLCYCVGAIATTYSVPMLSGKVSYNAILTGAAILMIVASVFYMAITFPGAKGCAEGKAQIRIADLLKEPALLLFSFVLFFQGAIEGITNNRISQYLINVENFTSVDAGYALSFVLIGLAIGRLLAGFILKHLSKKTIIAAGMIIALIGVVLLSRVQAVADLVSVSGQSVAITGTLLIGFGITSTVPIVLSVLGGLFKEASGTAFSIAISVCLIGNSLLNYVLGLLGIAAFPFMIGGCMLMVIILFSIGGRRFKTE